jgi:hypothetical protein
LVVARTGALTAAVAGAAGRRCEVSRTAVQGGPGGALRTGLAPASVRPRLPGCRRCAAAPR